MRAASLCLGLILLAGSAARAEAPGWVLYTHPDQLLSVRFPRAPSESEEDAPSSIGNIHFKMALYADPQHALCAAAVSFALNDAKFDVKKALAGARDQMVANVEGKITREKPIALDGFTGREVWFEAAGPEHQVIHAVARLFASAKPPRVFIISAMRLTDRPDPAARKFLDSAHLGKKVERARVRVSAP